jgi:hypothetical protein
MRTHARYEQNNGQQQQPRKAMKVKAEKVKTEMIVKHEDSSAININNNNNNHSNINNNDLSMFNQNSLQNINELRMKLQESFLAHSGLVHVPNDLSNLNREIKIEF